MEVGARLRYYAFNTVSTRCSKTNGHEYNTSSFMCGGETRTPQVRIPTLHSHLQKRMLVLQALHLRNEQQRAIDSMRVGRSLILVKIWSPKMPGPLKNCVSVCKASRLG
jgi:hypothetical protein